MNAPEPSQNNELSVLEQHELRVAERRAGVERTIDAVTNAPYFNDIVREVLTEARQRFPRLGLHLQGRIIDESPAPPRLEQE